MNAFSANKQRTGETDISNHCRFFLNLHKFCWWSGRACIGSKLLTGRYMLARKQWSSQKKYLITPGCDAASNMYSICQDFNRGAGELVLDTRMFAAFRKWSDDSGRKKVWH